MSLKPCSSNAPGLFSFAGLRTTYTGLVPLGAAPAPFTLDLNDETPLTIICELSEDGTCEACQ